MSGVRILFETVSATPRHISLMAAFDLDFEKGVAGALYERGVREAAPENGSHLPPFLAFESLAGFHIDKERHCDGQFGEGHCEAGERAGVSAPARSLLFRRPAP